MHASGVPVLGATIQGIPLSSSGSQWLQQDTSKQFLTGSHPRAQCKGNRETHPSPSLSSPERDLFASFKSLCLRVWNTISLNLGTDRSWHNLNYWELLRQSGLRNNQELGQS